MVEKALEEEYVKQFINMQNLIADTGKVMIKKENHHILNIGIQIIYMVEQCHKNFQ